MNWQAAVERTVTGMGYDLVDVERSAGGLLRVYIDRVESRAYPTGPGAAVTVDDCEVVTRQLQYVLEVEAADYDRLEVSSPGLDRPLKKPADWARFVGCEVEVTLHQPFQNRRKWRGELQARDGGWRLVLPDSAAKGKGKAGGKARTKPAKLVPAAKSATQAQDKQDEALDFALDEVREARLVPVVDFKGRRGHVAEPAQVDGGQD